MTIALMEKWLRFCEFSQPLTLSFPENVAVAPIWCQYLMNYGTGDPKAMKSPSRQQQIMFVAVT
jgi:hypothetical protein